MRAVYNLIFRKNGRISIKIGRLITGNLVPLSFNDVKRKDYTSAMMTFIEKQAKIKIPEDVREDFIDDVLEDLELMDQTRIVGLGITIDQLKGWIKKRDDPYTL